MSKEHISATVDEEVAAYLSQDHVNASGLVNDLVKEYKDGGNGETAMLRLRAEQLRSELESIESQREAKKNELERINQSITDAESGPDMASAFGGLLDDMEADGVHMWPECEPVAEIAREHDEDPADIIESMKQLAAEQDRDIRHTQFKRADMARGEQGRPISEVYGDE